MYKCSLNLQIHDSLNTNEYQDGFRKPSPILCQIIKKLFGILIHVFLTMDTNDYTWLSITNNQQQIVQNMQLLGCWAGFHPSTTDLFIMLSNSVALFPSNYISTRQCFLANLIFSFYCRDDFFPLRLMEYVNCLCLRHETFS